MFILENKTLFAVNDMGKAFEKVGLEQTVIIVGNHNCSLNNKVNILSQNVRKNKIPQNYFFINNSTFPSANSSLILEKSI